MSPVVHSLGGGFKCVETTGNPIFQCTCGAPLGSFVPVPWEPRYDERMGNGDCWHAGAKRRSHDFGPTKDFEVSDGDLVVESRQSVKVSQRRDRAYRLYIAAQHECMFAFAASWSPILPIMHFCSRACREQTRESR